MFREEDGRFVYIVTSQVESTLPGRGRKVRKCNSNSSNGNIYNNNNSNNNSSNRIIISKIL